jgi:hypothetical protein
MRNEKIVHPPFCIRTLSYTDYIHKPKLLEYGIEFSHRKDK